MQTPRNPYLTVDIIIECESEIGDEGIVMIERKNPPHGSAGRIRRLRRNA